MLLSKSLKIQEKSLDPVPPAILAPLPGTAGRKGRLMTTFEDFFGAAFGKLQEKSISYVNMTAGNDDFRTTLGRPNDDPMTTE